MITNTSKNHSLTIFSWNTSGLEQHLIELQHILQKTDTDIALISETHFTPNSCAKIYDFTVHFSSYPDSTVHAGAAIYIKSNIAHHSLPPYITPHKQVSGVSIVMHNNIPVTVYAVYCSPGITTTLDYFSNYFSTSGHRFISDGDCNSKNPTWGNRSPNTRDRALQQRIINKNYLSLAFPGPIYWSSHNN